jgi:hypothetical protein
MNYLYEAIKPTRLYIKQCPHCGLKYFGKHSGQDIEKYPGSGVRWNNHLNYHEVEPVHLWNSDWYYDTSISRFALKFSHINKIVESDVWANLKLEDGLNGGFDHLNDGSELHIERTRKGRLGANKTIKEKYGVENISQTEEQRELQSQRTKDLWKSGVFDHIDHKTRLGKTNTEESKRLVGMKNYIHQSGSGNSKYGTVCITNGRKNKKVKKGENIPNGWYRGRKMK